MIVQENIKDTVELRKSCIDTLINIAEKDSKLCFIDTDLASSSGSKAFENLYKDRYFNIGIMEAEAIGIAAGLSVTGYKCFVHSFAPFISRRCFDQSVVSCAYADAAVVLLGSDPGITAALNGGTHTTFEDIAMFRALSNTTVLDACDAVQMAELTEMLAKNMKGLNYIRFARRPSRKIYHAGMKFQIGRGVTLREGTDICIFASGVMISQALDVADILEERGKTVRVIDLFSILPIDEEIIVKAARECRHLVSLDNHNIRGGLGSAVAEVLATKAPAKLQMFGASSFGQVGTYDQLLDIFGWTGVKLAEQIFTAVQKER